MGRVPSVRISERLKARKILGSGRGVGVSLARLVLRNTRSAEPFLIGTADFPVVVVLMALVLNRCLFFVCHTFRRTVIMLRLMVERIQFVGLLVPARLECNLICRIRFRHAVLQVVQVVLPRLLAFAASEAYQRSCKQYRFAMRHKMLPNPFYLERYVLSVGLGKVS